LENLPTYIESLIFSADQPITRDEVRYALENCFDTTLTEEVVDIAVEDLKDKYQNAQFSIEVTEIAGGLQFMTKPAYHHVVGSHLKLITKKRLSRVALETLAIIAYKQPVTKTELEKIRGVNCDYAVQKLLEKEQIIITGRAEGPGKPLLYATSDKFMDYLGLKDLNDLPKLRDIHTADNAIGESGAIDEEMSVGSAVAGQNPEDAPSVAPGTDQSIDNNDSEEE